MGDQERTFRVIEYKPGVSREQYLDLFSQGVQQILRSDSRRPAEDVADYAEENLTHLLANIEIVNADMARAVRPQKRWLIGTAAAGIVLAALTAYGGATYNDSQFKSAVTEREDYKGKLTATQGLYSGALRERDVAKEQVSQGLEREKQKDEALDEIVAKAKELGILSKE